MRLVRHLLILGVVTLWAAVSGVAHGQYMPIGSHNAPLDNASGHGSDMLSPTGSIGQAVPLDLPPPRGELD